MNYQKGDIKSQVASVVRHLPKYYQFQTLGEYNALLSLFNIAAERVESELHGKMQQGLLYIPLKENGERAGHPFKASLFGKNAGLPALDLHFAKCKQTLKDKGAKATIKAAITIAVQKAGNEKGFKKQLAEQGINTVVRRNDTGRIYGVTFIDHNSKTVWNGSRLGKEFAANTFNDYWNNNIKPDLKNEPEEHRPKIKQQNKRADLPAEKPHELFDFLDKDVPDFSTVDIGIIENIGGLLLEAQGEDYEELDFANRMKKKRKRKRNR